MKMNRKICVAFLNFNSKLICEIKFSKKHCQKKHGKTFVKLFASTIRLNQKK